MIDPDPRGAVLEDMLLMRKVLSDRVRIKASGGIYELDYALELIKNGANHLGISRREELIEEFKRRFGYSVQI
ncbi:hypothetical protein DRJ04_09450 [Candidatus Aerophobetes bacterium]|uniref:Quinolinate phosphoribosyl transferase C-terminal domain-containing protein n=1 Tax=Aerophobetes bacterium TaxID=2030807 RepID=A0A662D568_UNCAE|nr:MAG: hypothetical protein DRJ04_09450 [Candidatus Aerophobetes bacterium]